MRQRLRAKKGGYGFWIGLSILLIWVVIALAAPWIAPYDPQAPIFESAQAPSAEHWMGTSRLKQDLFSQLIVGTQYTLLIAFSSALIATFIALWVGLTAAYFGGGVDLGLNAVVNAFLVIPGLPLMIVVAGYLSEPGPEAVIIILSITSWAQGARIVRSQVLSLKEREYIRVARMLGERRWRILVVELMPNMISLVFAVFLATVLTTILAAAALEFLGLADRSMLTWGTMLYWAQQSAAIQQGQWWWFVPPGLAIASVALSIALINMGVDRFVSRRQEGQHA